MAVIKGEQTLNEILILEVAGDPSINGGTPAPTGSEALDDTGVTWKKTGPLDTDWKRVFTSGALYTADIGITNNTSSDIPNLNDLLDHMWSAGVTEGAGITDNGNGTINIASAIASLRATIIVTSITRTLQVATVTTPIAHGYTTGDITYIVGAVQPEYNGQFNIISTGTNTFTYVVSGSPASPATGTIITVSEDSPINIVNIPAVTNFALTDHATNYVYCDWNAGTPQFNVTTTSTAILGLSRADAWVIAREGNTLWILDSRSQNVDVSNKINIRNIAVEPFRHEQDGYVITASSNGTRTIAGPASAYWRGLTRITSPSFDTGVSSTFTVASTANSGTSWTYTSGQTQINNTQYNNTSSGLVSLSTGNYGVHWVYMMNNSPDTLMVVFGQGDYTHAQAFGVQIPTIIPTIVKGVGVLIGRVIIQNGASVLTDVTSNFTTIFPNTHPTLDTLTDVLTPSPNLNDVLSWNGTSWVNAASNTVSGGAVINYYDTTPIINTTGTQNSNILGTLALSPIVTSSTPIVNVIPGGTTTFQSAWSLGTALGRTVFDAGTWNATIFAGVNQDNGGHHSTISKYIYQTVPSSTNGYTASTTNASGTSSTVTISSSVLPTFVAGDASATITIGSYFQTPKGLYKIIAFTDSSHVTIQVPTGYTAETAVAFTKWINLFGMTSGYITSLTPIYAAIALTSTQPAYSVALTDSIGQIQFATSIGGTTVTTVYGGAGQQAVINTPLSFLHNQLPGLQGGSSNQYYHLTSAEYTGSGTGVFARVSSPVFTTPNIGTATGTATNITASSNSTLTTLSALSLPIAQLTMPITTITAATYSILASDYTIIANPTSNSIVLTLPTAVGATGRVYNIKRTVQNANSLTINTTSSQTIDGGLTAIITRQSSVTIQSDGSNWWIL